MTEQRRLRGGDGLVVLDPGELPNPRRINSLLRHLGRLYDEIMAVDDGEVQMVLKDRKTIENYRKLLVEFGYAEYRVETICNSITYWLARYDHNLAVSKRNKDPLEDLLVKSPKS